MKRWFERRAKESFFAGLREIQGGFLEVVCPDQTYAFGDCDAPLRAMAVVHDERFFVRALLGADVGIGESYMDGDWTSPDLVALIRLCVRNRRAIDMRRRFLATFRSLGARLAHRLRSNTVRGSRSNIHAHYDIGNDFYRLFLDAAMVYSSAYFRRPDDSLELAQQEKIDRICRKLQIDRGERVLEIGCGWGAFAVHAARHYGARVTALTISRAQYDYVSELFSRTDLAPGYARVLLEDYRLLDGQFDKIVSIEMFEAVGFDHYNEFFAACDRLLAEDGSMLLQTISISEQEVPAYRKRVDWMQTYIFPGSELASLQEIQRSIGRVSRLALTHLESFGLHYARTLAAWRERFFQNLEQVRRLGFDDRFQRMWDFYLAWCEGGFRERYINVAQILFAKNGTLRPLLGDPDLFASPLPSRSLSL